MGLDHAPDPRPSAGGAKDCAQIHEDLHEVSSADVVVDDGDCHRAVEEEACIQVRKLEPVDPMDPLDVLFPHERSPDASHGHKRSAATALADGDVHSALLEHPCDKKLRRDDHAGAATVAGTDIQLLRRPRLPSVSAMPAATATPVSSTRLLSPLDVADADQLRQHIRDVRREVFLRPMIAIVTRLMFHKYNHGLFNVRVDPIEWNIPHYLEVVKTPMDLTLVKTKCLNLEYASVDECVADIKLVFSNARLFNPPGHIVHECAELLAKEFDAEFARYQSKKAIQDKRREEHSCPSCLANVCGICNEKCINFEPPLVMCSGPCKQRIKRHAVYYKTQDRLNFWCAKCYTTLPKIIGLTPTGHGREEVKMSKHELVKAKFVDELTEPWVQCDSCDGWVHQVCALFNSCENAEDAEEVPYTCPGCRLQSLEQDESSWKQLETLPSETSVDEFPIKHHRELMASVGSHSPIVKCKPPVKDFTRVLGFGVEAQQKVLDYLRAEDVQAFELSVSQMGGACRTSSQLLSSPLSTFMQNWTRQFLVNVGEPEVADSIVIKVASCIKSQGVLSPIVREQFQSSALKYPETMEYTSKAIFVFQKIDGVEVCIFSMYVQEYNAAAAVVANRNRTYIAYIDSLVYMRPRHIRTKLFHEILISYLAFCKGKGFEYAHIWACPTTRGGDFIYWCHPSFQKNPGKDRLLQWYLAMVEKAKQAGVAFSCEDLYTTNFKSLEDQLEQQLPPYFDGDYWAAEVERLHANPPKRGKLSKEKYEESLRGEKFRKKLVESVRLSRESLFVIALQPKCSTCNTLVINSSCWKVCDTQAFVCDACKAPDAIDVEILEPPSFVKSCENVDEEEVSCPFVDYRADMLKNCEEHHYQFDSFRRAKYSTMMLIYHIASTQRAVPRTDARV